MKTLNSFSSICIYLLTFLLLSNYSIAHAQWTKVYVDTLAPGAFIPTVADIGEDGDLDILIPRITDFNTFDGEIPGYGEIHWFTGESQCYGALVGLKVNTCMNLSWYIESRFINQKSLIFGCSFEF